MPNPETSPTTDLDRRLVMDVLRGGLRDAVVAAAPDAPQPLREAWLLALDDAFTTADEYAGEQPDDVRVYALEYLQAFACELAFEMARFTDDRDPEVLGTNLSGIVAAQLNHPAIAA